VLVSHETKTQRPSDVTCGTFLLAQTDLLRPISGSINHHSQQVIIARLSFILHSCVTIPVSQPRTESKKVVVWKNRFESSSFFHHKRQVLDVHTPD